MFGYFDSLLKRVHQEAKGRRSKARVTRPARCRLHLEQLEDRLAPSTSAIDPGFEQSVVGNGFQYDPSGGAWIFTGSAGVAGNGCAFTRNNFSAPEGSQVGFLQGTGSVSQSVTFTSSGTFTISVLASQRAFDQQSFQVLVDGNVVGTFLPTTTQFALFTTSTFTVSAGAHTIAFQGLNSAGDHTAFIDLVTIVEQPTSLANFGFEQPAVGNGFQYNPSGGTWAFTGTAGVAGNNSAFTNANFSAPQGSQVAFLQQSGSISQSVTFTNSGTFSLSFLAAQRAGNQQNFEVLVDGNIVGTFLPTNTQYALFTTSTFTASAGAHTITFQGLNSAGGDNTAFIDAVSITAQISSLSDFGFEQPAVGNGFQYNPSGAPWTFTGTAGVTGNHSAFTNANFSAPQGSQVAFLQQSGSISQSVTFTNSGTFSLSFLATQRAGNQQNFEVLVDGNIVGTFLPTTTRYQLFTTSTFTVSAGAHTITFQGLNSAGGDNTAFIDEVTIMAQPTSLNDPGFEQPSVGNSFQYNPSGGAWTFTGSAGITGNNSGFTNANFSAPQGTQAGFLQGTGSISQSVTFTNSGTFTISFLAAQRSGNREDVQVLVDGSVVGTFLPTTTRYRLFTTSTFAVSAGPHTITFQGLDSAGGDHTVFIDAVSIAQVPFSLINPGFELPAVGNGFQYNPSGGTWAFTGTAGVAGNNSAFTNANFSAPQGSQVAFLQQSGSISQSVTFTNSGTFSLSFLAAQRAGNQQNFEVLVDGNIVGTFTPTTTRYQLFNTSLFVVSAGAHTITFQGLNSAGGDNTAFIDAVSITAQPLTLLIDADFEERGVGNGFQYGLRGVPWNFVGAAGITGNNSLFTRGNFAPPEGGQVAFLQQSSNLSQSVIFPSDGTFTISFLASQRAFNREAFEVLVDGIVVGTFVPTSNRYELFLTSSFTVTAGVHTITFQGVNDAGGDNTAFIDTVSINS